MDYLTPSSFLRIDNPKLHLFIGNHSLNRHSRAPTMKVPWILFPTLAYAHGLQHEHTKRQDSLPRLQDFECGPSQSEGDSCATTGFSGKQISGICRKYDLKYVYCSVPREECREEYDGMPCWQKSFTEAPTRFARCLDEVCPCSEVLLNPLSNHWIRRMGRASSVT